jgi:hypothetical protein
MTTQQTLGIFCLFASDAEDLFLLDEAAIDG